jgi:putative endopeptidase
MDTATINALGNKPLQPWLKKVDEVQDMKSLTSLLVELGHYDNGAFFGWSITGDSKHPEKRAFYMGPGGTTLPDQTFYMSNDQEMLEHRKNERDIIEKLLINGGVDPVQARKDALNVSVPTFLPESVG